MAFAQYSSLAVAGLKNPVAFGKALYYFGSGTLGIVVQKSEAFFLQSYFAEIMVPPPSTVSPVIENNGLTRRDGALGLVKTIFTLPSTETSAVAAASFALYLGFCGLPACRLRKIGTRHTVKIVCKNGFV